MRGLPEIPAEDVAEYWQLVRDALVASGMSKKEAAVVAKAYREYMKPASWTIYNTDPEDSAEAAKDYEAWKQELREQEAAKANVAPKRAKKPGKAAGK